MDSSAPVVWVVTCVVVPVVSVALYLAYQGKSKANAAAVKDESEFVPGYVPVNGPACPPLRLTPACPTALMETACLRSRS